MRPVSCNIADLGLPVDDLVRRICSVCSPVKIVVFGSHARGQAGPASDLDVLIVEEKSELPRYRRAAPYRMALSDLWRDRDIDIVVWTQQEIQEWAGVPQAFISTVLREGRAVYEKPQ